MAPPEDDITGVLGVKPPQPGDRRPCLIVVAGANLGAVHLLAATESIVGRARDATIVLPDETVSRSHARIRYDGDTAWIEDLDSRNGTFVNGLPITTAVRLHEGDKVALGQDTILKFAYHDAVDDELHHQLYDAALRDGLTHVYNRRFFDDRLEAEVRLAVRHKSPLALVLFDLDHFKCVNDQHGHLGGDHVLAEVAAVAQGSLRREDIIARLGGEEFAILCGQTTLTAAEVLAERLRGLVEAMAVDIDGVVVRVTVSIGVAALPDLRGDTARGLFAAADSAMYLAKAQGRNRVVVHHAEEEETRDAPWPSPPDGSE